VAGDLEIRPELREQFGDLLGGADRRSRFEDDDVAGLEDDRSVGRSLEDIANVRRVILPKGRRDRDNEDVRRFDLQLRAEIAAGHHAGD
jgi:hypothetical protein